MKLFLPGGAGLVGLNLIALLQRQHPDWQLLFEIDWSSGHAKHRDGSLNTNTMNVGYGGGQKIPRGVKIPTEVWRSASLCPVSKQLVLS